jgi:RimJ/RimL family protein N-acetyltransferase
MFPGKNYLFTSERLGFRDWLDEDLAEMSAINTDPRVMAFFPALKSREESKEFIIRMKAQYAEKGFCYFAVDKLENAAFIGFIGLSEQTFESEFTPCIDIGWRLAFSYWNKGYAIEGAKRCLEFAFRELHLEKICAIAPKLNLRSESIMKKLAMSKVSDFEHPKLMNDPRLKDCVLYEIKKVIWEQDDANTP